jgi:uncharacterized membrane protein YgcG
MKCSDCKLWKTSECKNNPEVKDLDYAETFACFESRESAISAAVNDQENLEPDSSSSHPSRDSTVRWFLIMFWVFWVVVVLGALIIYIVFTKCAPDF